MKLKMNYVVKTLLEEDPYCRENDFYLYYQTVITMYPNEGLGDHSFSWVMLHATEYELPSFAGVTRARRAIQVNNPDLCSLKTLARRKRAEIEYRRKYRKEDKNA